MSNINSHNHEECSICHKRIHEAVAQAEVEAVQYFLRIVVHAGVFLSAVAFILKMLVSSGDIRDWLQTPVTIMATVIVVLSLSFLKADIRERRRLRKAKSLSLSREFVQA